jgi:hypothetical protein
MAMTARLFLPAAHSSAACRESAHPFYPYTIALQKQKTFCTRESRTFVRSGCGCVCVLCGMSSAPVQDTDTLASPASPLRRCDDLRDRTPSCCTHQHYATPRCGVDHGRTAIGIAGGFTRQTHTLTLAVWLGGCSPVQVQAVSDHTVQCHHNRPPQALGRIEGQGGDRESRGH